MEEIQGRTHSRSPRTQHSQQRTQASKQKRLLKPQTHLETNQNQNHHIHLNHKHLRRRYSSGGQHHGGQPETCWRRRLEQLRISHRPAFSLKNLLISLTLLLSLNLTTSFTIMHPNLVHAATGSSTGSSSSSTSTTSATGQQQQQQQSNSVIQSPSLTAAATTTATTSSLTTTKARYKTMYACEDRQLTMDCETGSKINLIRANFGRFSITQCNEQGQLDLSTDCMSPITFRIMQERCQDRQRCSVNATSVLFGDRCPKTRKYLEVHFQCQALEPDVVDVRKFQQAVIAQQQRDQQLMQPQGAAVSPIHGPGSSHLKPANNPTSAPPASSRFMPQGGAAGAYQPSPSMFADDYHSPSSPHSPSVVQQQQQQQQNEQQQQQATPVINSLLMNSSMALNQQQLQMQQDEFSNNNLPDLDPASQQSSRELPIIVSLRHLQIENMSKPRCYQWDASLPQWTDRGARILQTNQTHTTCAFDQATSYVLVMDYAGPTISPSSHINKPNAITRLPNGNNNQQQQQQQQQQQMIGPPVPDLLDNQPIPVDNNYPPQPQGPFMAQNPFDVNKIIHPPAGPLQQQQQHHHHQSSELFSFFSLFSYLLGIVVVAVALLTLAFVGSSMKSSANRAFKSLGNFAHFGGPKYKHRRQDGAHHQGPNKDLLVVNNSNGHQFIYAPASTTKISGSSSTHILSTAGQPNGGGGNAHQGTLHRLSQQQQQQLYSGNGATLSSLSGTGAQSNNYYYGLMGLNPLFQQQQQQQQQHQQQHHFSQHHLNQPQIATAHSQQVVVSSAAAVATSYNHQANKSMSNESANSSSSSSGVESGSTSMQQHQQQQQQQQQVQTQQACLVSAMNNNDFNLMGHHISNYGRHPAQQTPSQQQLQQHNLFATMKNGPNFNNSAHQQHQPTLTVNAHYSTSGGNMQSMSGGGSSSMTPNHMLHQRQTSSQMRDHIYECVDDDKPYMARLLMPQGQQPPHQHGGVAAEQQLLQQQPAQTQQAFSTWRDTLRYKCVALPVPKVV